MRPIQTEIVLISVLGLAVACATLARPSSVLRSSHSSGSTRLPTGLNVEFEYHYDRNALLDFRVVGDSVFALARAGHLLRFNRDSLQLAQEGISGVPFTSLGGSGTTLLAGRQDGKVYRIVPDKLELELVAEFPNEIAWIGSFPDAGGKLVYVAVLR